MKQLAAVLLLGFLCGRAGAEAGPRPDGLDPRVEAVHYVPDQPVYLDVPVDAMLAILLEPGEHVRRTTLRDPGTYQIAIPGKADSIFVHALGRRETLLAVVTDQRSYELVLRATSAATAPYLVYFAPQSVAAAKPTPPQMAPKGIPGRYKVSGNRGLRPVAIHDDGTHTYIQWDARQPIPAVFSLDDLGREEMVNGYMREGIFTIDRIHDQLVFRIDKARANARRFIPQEAK